MNQGIIQHLDIASLILSGGDRFALPAYCHFTGRSESCPVSYTVTPDPHQPVMAGEKRTHQASGRLQRRDREERHEFICVKSANYHKQPSIS